MVQIAIALLGVCLLLGLGEYFYKTKKLRGEYARKFVHISVGLFVASWPLFLPWYYITLVSIILTVTVALAKHYRWFRSVYSVKRSTSGELMYALGVGATAALFHDGYIFSAAILIMALADGLAALIGTRFGKSTSYQLLGNTKTVIGSVAFFVVALTVNLLYWFAFGHTFSALILPTAFLYLASISAAAIETGMEAVMPNGFDNLAVPLLSALLLTLFK